MSRHRIVTALLTGLAIGSGVVAGWELRESGRWQSRAVLMARRAQVCVELLGEAVGGWGQCLDVAEAGRRQGDSVRTRLIEAAGDRAAARRGCAP